MKKAIRQPENWQDFETLCKKLFGEIWGCSLTIKKNGRLGQPQSGVDIYGKPNGETEYWGVQCKGKDNYSDSKLTEAEILSEINKAHLFEPKLKTFILATTAVKDVNIEKFVRLKDQESCSNGNFQIVLFCWQDIADLIEDNRDTFNWYVNELQFKDKFDIDVTFATKSGNDIATPKFLKTLVHYMLRPEFGRFSKYGPVVIPPLEYNSLFGSNKVNHSWCSFTTKIFNSGSVVLEDWKCYLTFPDNIRQIDDDFTKGLLVSPAISKTRTTWAYSDERQILFKPLNNCPLIQKEGLSFKSFFIPGFESKEVIIKWHILARDFDREGEFKFSVESEYELDSKFIYVESSEEVKEEEVLSEYIADRKKIGTA